MTYRIHFSRSDAMMESLPEGTPWESKVMCDEFVQITYDQLRAGPDGDPIAHMIGSEWFRTGDPLPYSDVTIS